MEESGGVSTFGRNVQPKKERMLLDIVNINEEEVTDGSLNSLKCVKGHLQAWIEASLLA